MGSVDLMCFFFFQAEDGIRDRNVTEFRRVLFRSRTGADAASSRHLPSPVCRARVYRENDTRDSACGNHKLASAKNAAVLLESRSEYDGRGATHQDRKSVV